MSKFAIKFVVKGLLGQVSVVVSHVLVVDSVLFFVRISLIVVVVSEIPKE